MAGAAMSRRMIQTEVARLESLIESRNGKPALAPVPVVAAAPAPAIKPPEPEKTEEVTPETIMVLTAAVAAFLGKRARIRERAAGTRRPLVRLGAARPRICSGFAQFGGRARAMKLRITVDQKTYEVDVEVAEDDRPPAPAPSACLQSGRADGGPVRASAAAARRRAGCQRR